MKDIGQYPDNKDGKQKEKYADLFYNAPVGYVILDSGYKITGINKLGSALLNDEKPDLPGKEFSDFIAPGNLDSFQFFMKNLKAGKSNVQCGLKLKNKSVSVSMLGASGMGKEFENQSYRLVFFNDSDFTNRDSEDDFGVDESHDIKDLASSDSIITRDKSISDKIFEDLTVLVADDDEVTRIYLSELIEKKCKTMFFAKNGQEAVDFFQENSDINLILMDIKMPVMDGYSATIKIKEMDKNVVVIAQTAYALASDREKALAAGCDDYLAKPLLKKDLFAVLEKFFK